MMISFLTNIASNWLSILGNASLDGGIVLLIVLCIRHWLQRIPSHWRCWLWRLAFAKLLAALLWVSPIVFHLSPSSARHEPRIAVRTAEMIDSSAEEASSTNISTEFTSTATANGEVVAPTARIAGPLTQLGLTNWLFIGWTLGASVVVIRLTRQWIQLRCAISRSSPVINTDVRSKVQELCHRLQLSKCPILLLSECEVPFTTGVVRPTIVIPQTLQNNESELEAVLLHELAHVKRRDVTWNLLIICAGILFFFHPLVWLARRRWRLDQEIAADELALTNIRNIDCASYINCLIHFVASRESRPALSLQVSESFSQTKQRIEAITRFVPQPRKSKLAMASCAFVAFTAVFTSWTLSSNASESENEGSIESSTAVESAMDQLKPFGDVRSMFEPSHEDHRVQLILKGTKVTDDTMLLVRDIARTSPVELKLDSTRVTAEGLKHLQGTSVTDFSANGNVIDDDAMSQLATFPKLKRIALSTDIATDEGLASLRSCKTLQSLGITGIQFTGTGLEPLTALEQLRELYLGESFDESSVEAINKLQRLTHLGLSSSRSTRTRSTRILSQATIVHQLESIDLPNAMIDDEFATVLDRCTNLRQLWLFDATFTTAGLTAIGNLKELTHLSISGSSINDADMHHLENLKQLTWLDVSDTQVGDDSLPVVAKFKKLRHFFTLQSDVSDDGVRRLKTQLPTLRFVDVD
ncbi:MAG: M48 family metalloprotease [Planctomycetales bacterium]|nr:M48 family metalloprotease [Planctomycetales bacterium]